MKLTKEQEYYSQKGKKYRDYSRNDYWDIIVKGVRYHSDGYTLWLDIISMKNNSGEWMEDGTQLDGLILDVQRGRTKEIN